MHGDFHRTSIGFGFLALMSLPFAIHPHEGEATRRELPYAVRDRKGARHPSRLLLTHLGHSRSIPLVQEETEEHRVPSMERPGSVVFFRQNQERMLREHARSLFSAALQNPGFRAKPQSRNGTLRNVRPIGGRRRLRREGLERPMHIRTRRQPLCRARLVQRGRGSPPYLRPVRIRPRKRTCTCFSACRSAMAATG